MTQPHRHLPLIALLLIAAPAWASTTAAPAADATLASPPVAAVVVTAAPAPQDQPATTTPATAPATAAAPAHTDLPLSPAARPATVVGDAARGLLERQRSGVHASASPRPIDGATAALSQQRLLKSFEHPLPLWFGSRLESSSK